MDSEEWFNNLSKDKKKQILDLVFQFFKINIYEDDGDDISSHIWIKQLLKDNEDIIAKKNKDKELEIDGYKSNEERYKKMIEEDRIRHENIISEYKNNNPDIIYLREKNYNLEQYIKHEQDKYIVKEMQYINNLDNLKSDILNNPMINELKEQIKISNEFHLNAIKQLEEDKNKLLIEKANFNSIENFKNEIKNDLNYIQVNLINNIEKSSLETHSKISDVSNFFSKNKSKGELGEIMSGNILKKHYHFGEVTCIARETDTADIRLFNNKLRIQIEVKNYSDISLKSNHKRILSDFINKSIKVKKQGLIDFSVFVQIQDINIPTKNLFEIEEIQIENEEPLMIIYVSGIISNEERLPMAIELLTYAFKNMRNDNKNMIHTYIAELKNEFIKIEKNLIIREKDINSSIECLKNDKISQLNITKSFNNINNNSIVEQNLESTIISFYKELSTNGNITKDEFINKCKEKCISYDPKKFPINEIKKNSKIQKV